MAHKFSNSWEQQNRTHELYMEKRNRVISQMQKRFKENSGCEKILQDIWLKGGCSEKNEKYKNYVISVIGEIEGINLFEQLENLSSKYLQQKS